MKLFNRMKRKRRHSLGKGNDTAISLHKEMEILNYTPIDYRYTVPYADFLQNAEKNFRRLINATSPDDLCENMLDSFINAAVGEMKASAEEQYTHHIHFISHYKGIVDGHLAQGRRQLKHLQQDLAGMEGQIQKLQSL